MLRSPALPILLLAALLLIGCARIRQAQQAEQRRRQLEEQGTVTFETESGARHSVTNAEDLDTSQLSIAIYPGAIGEQSQISTYDQEKQLHFTFTTTDSFDKIADFYKSKYPTADAGPLLEISGRRLFDIDLREVSPRRSIRLIHDEFCDEDEVIIVLSQTEFTAR